MLLLHWSLLHFTPLPDTPLRRLLTTAKKTTVTVIETLIHQVSEKGWLNQVGKLHLYLFKCTE